jgi:hypothetical protein
MSLGWSSYQGESTYFAENGQYWNNLYVRKCFDRLSYLSRGYTLPFCPRIHQRWFIKLEFVRSAENGSDLFTKNVNQDFYEKHTKKIQEESEVYSINWLLQDRKGVRDILCNQPSSFTCLRIIH